MEKRLAKQNFGHLKWFELSDNFGYKKYLQAVILAKEGAVKDAQNFVSCFFPHFETLKDGKRKEILLQIFLLKIRSSFTCFAVHSNRNSDKGDTCDVLWSL